MVLQDDFAPYLLRFIAESVTDESMPQDSLSIFLLAHILLARTGHVLTSKFEGETDERKRSLFAIAEIYYWLNLKGIDNGRRKQSKTAA
jgi:hypothetical protein